MKEKTTKKEIVKMVAKHAEVSQSTSQQVIDALFDCIGEELAAGRDVELRRFGTFVVHTNKTRVISDISGQPATVPEHRIAKYRCGTSMRAILNGSHEGITD
ncbi:MULTISPECIES: HU family DNA-binding protein [Furfurilactobacillus]|uniref:DNA-binding protein HU n=1 Tax=Furfurilactobacillus rossiae TaxID=231049 RepID=A0A7C9IUM6_9LACO|nr:HU family DNA-binding protein [Furfurilactobacillus milii]MYV06079.1 hypothetical protein [Furfurilactobacillus milii]